MTTPIPSSRASSPRGKHLDYWHWSVKFDADFLRLSDPIDMLVATLSALPELAEHKERLFIIIAELFNNALDHGLLGLDSADKKNATGFEDYYQQRQKQLYNLTQGTIQCDLSCRFYNPGGCLSIRVRDSGPGFNPNHLKPSPVMSVTDPPEHDTASFQHHAYCGMGINLVRSFCKEFRISPQGNEIEAVYEW